MQFYQIISALMDVRNISAYKLWKDTKIAQSVIGRWKANTAMPSTENLQILAEYFKVTTDYLLGNEQKNKPTDRLGELKNNLNNIVDGLTNAELEKLLEHAELLEAARQKRLS